MNQRHLFNDADWSSVEKHQHKLLHDEILEFDSQRILTSSLEDLVDYLAEKYALQIPQLQKEHAAADQQEREIDVSGDRSRYWSSPGTSSAVQKSLLQFLFGRSRVFQNPAEHLHAGSAAR